MVIMKRISLSLLVALLCVAWASGADVQGRIAYIRQAYDAAQSAIAMADDEPMTRNTFSITVDQMYPGSGPHKEKIEFFFTCLDFDVDDHAEDGSIVWRSQLYLVRQSYNIGGHEFYNEYLYDMETGEPLFALTTGPDDDGEQQSMRVYFDKGQVVHTIPATQLNPAGLLSEFKRLHNIFETVILRSPLI